MVSISIVTYNNDKIIKKCIQNIFKNINNIDFELIIVDNNSTDNTVSIIEKDFKNIRLIKNNRNIGFGAAHNIAIKLGRGKYHLVLNPDIIFTENSVEKLVNFMEANPEVGLVSPKIIFPDGRVQYLCKRSPCLFDLSIRRFAPEFIQNLFKNRIDYFEMKETGYNKIMDVSYLSGSFMLFRKNILEKIGGFDENFFMYFEDADITRRVTEISRSVFYPYISVVHLWERGSHKNIKYFIIVLISAIKYFNKWGWKIF
ncbi:MAG TPA: glycosyltransferase family 2 protein [Atribacterota bacterium]|nr:glycosyltransferase family 2 protein [Atribacterota bacterium]